MPHVAFVSLAGARVAEAELAALGATLPGLRRRGAAIEALPALGLLTLAGLTPGEWSRSWHEARRVDDALVEDVLAARPTLVAVSALTASVDEAYALSRALRAAGARVVLGGLHATACPDEAAREVDAVVVGEGEPVWLDVLRDAERGALAPRYQARAPFDLARAPLPAWSLLGPQVRPRFTLQTARGCPFACEFCGASRLLGPFREKPDARVEAELAAIRALDPRPVLELADDNTFAGRREPGPLLDLLARAGARWFTECDWRLGERPDVLARLAASGCVQVLVGVESLASTYPGMGRKAADLPRVLAALEAIEQAGVAVNACFVVGADGETPASLARLADLLDRTTFSEVQITVQTPFPGTPLRARLARESRLLRPDGEDWRAHTLFDVTFEPDAMTPEALALGFRALLAHAHGAAPSARRATHRRAVWRRRLKSEDRCAP